MSAAASTEVEVLDSRRLGAAWTLDRVWKRLRRRGDPPSRRQVATRRIAIEACPGFTDDAAYAATDFLLDAPDAPGHLGHQSPDSDRPTRHSRRSTLRSRLLGCS